MAGSTPAFRPIGLTAAPRSVLLLEAALLVVFGLAGLVFPALASIAAVVLFGWILIASGLMGLVSAFAARPHLHFGWSLLSAVAAVLAGFAIAVFPLSGVVALTILIAAWLLVDGVSSMMIANGLRRSHKTWIWSVLSALVDWLLALVVLVLAPAGGFLIVGVVVGVDLVFGGLALGMTAAWGRRRDGPAAG
jgi:uncharacterized membrane protein HdeD (DUF308 family)